MSNAQAILAKLKDVQNPQAISMWPETIAWYIVFAVILLLIIWLVVRFLNLYFKKRRQQQALQLLNEATSKYHADPSSAIAEISILLRRIALAKFKREQVASLSSNEWLTFLDKPLNTTEFSEGIGSVLVTAPYQKQVTTDIKALSNLVERWIKRVL